MTADGGLRRAVHRLPLGPAALFDLLLALGYLFFVTVVPPALGLAWTATDEPLQALTVWFVQLLLAGAIALRRASPPWALGVAWAAGVLQTALGVGPVVADVGFLLVLYAAAAYGDRVVRWVGFASAVAAALIAAGSITLRAFPLFLELDPAPAIAALQAFGSVALSAGAVLLLAWTAGLLAATARRAVRARTEADEAAQAVAAEQERTRIARDMHDVVAHSLAVVVAQSDGARMLRRAEGRAEPDASNAPTASADPAASARPAAPAEPDPVDEALLTIAATARSALADVRVLLQQLRYEGTTAVQPTADDLPALFDRFRASGLDLDVRAADLGGLGGAEQLALYRVVQEALTNALRHGDPAHPVVVRMHREADRVDVTVENALRAGRMRSVGGHGLVGMRERAAAVEGRLEAGADGDRWVVRAGLPVRGAAA